MKTQILISILLTISHLGFGQSIYNQKMQEALQKYAAVSSVEDYKTSAANFDMIANVENKKWQPLYYHAQAYIMMSFSDSKATEDQKDAYLTVAESSVQKMIELAPKESEIYALQALYYTAKLVINPMARGQKYGALTQTAIQQSLALDPDNPRAKYLNISNKIGTAQFFGGDISQYCQEGNALLAVWDDYPLKGVFYPQWGKNQLKQQLDACDQTTNELSEESTVSGNKLTVHISKLKPNTGLVLLELMDENKKTIRQVAGTVNEANSTIILENIPNGTYAIQYFQDANENKKMDTNKHGAPQEKYGFSNNKRGFMGAPKFKKTTFQVNGDLNIALKAK